jgi:hypothetical protein
MINYILFFQRSAMPYEATYEAPISTPKKDAEVVKQRIFSKQIVHTVPYLFVLLNLHRM